MHNLQKIKTPISYVSMQDGVLVSEMHSEHVNLSDMKAHNDMILAAFGGLLPCPSVVVPMAGAKQSDREVRSFMNTEDFLRTTKSLGIVSGSGLTRTMINLFLKFTRLPVPMRMFATLEEALEWSQQHK